MNRTAIVLRAGEATANNVLLAECALPIADPVVRQATDVWMYQPSGATGGSAVFPVAGKVEGGITYGPSGADYVGTLVQPAVGDVKVGVGYGADGTEFTGTLVNINPTRRRRISW